MINTPGRLLLFFLKPSNTTVFVGLAMAVVAFCMACYVIVSKETTLMQWYASHGIRGTDELRMVTAAINDSEWVASCAVFSVWFVVGTLLYALYDLIVRSLHTGLEFEREVFYAKNIDTRLNVLTQAASHAVVRIGGLLLLLVVYRFVFSFALPFVTVVMHKAVFTDIISLLVLSGLIVVCSLVMTYTVTIALRMVTYRARLLGYT